TETDVYHGMRIVLVPTDTPGIEFERHIGLMGEPPGEGMHALIHYNNVRVAPEGLLGGEGQAFAIAQTRLGGGRVHHAMRTVGMAQRALDMMCERALSRKTRDGTLAGKQSVQDMVADSYIELKQFRLLVLYVAWSIVRPRCTAPRWPARCSRATNRSKASGPANTCRPAGPPPRRSSRGTSNTKWGTLESRHRGLGRLHG